MNSHLQFFWDTRRVSLTRTNLRFLILPLLRESNKQRIEIAALHLL